MKSLREFFCLHKKFLVYNLVSRNLKVKYRRSLLGVFWTLLAPLCSALVYYLVFKVIIKVQKPDYLVVIFSGVMAWSYFSNTLTEGVSHYVDLQALISKISIPLQVFNFVGATTNMVTLILSIPVVVAVALLHGKVFSWSFLLLPFYMACLALIAYSLSIICAVCFVFFRDLRQAIGILLQLLFYATPVLYTVSMIPEEYRWILLLNPLGYLIPLMQQSFLGENPQNLLDLLHPLLWALSLSFASALLLRKFRWKVVESL